MIRFRRLLVAAAIGLALAYLGVLGFVYFNQRGLQYVPAGRIYELAETRLTGTEAIGIPTEGGAVLGGWYAPPAPGRPTILYFRGNAHSFTAEYERFEAFVADGYGFLSFDYRGFPSSPGKISEANILADALAALDWLAAKGDPILIWGRSLGSGPATWVAGRREARALLLETPFDSAVAVGAARYPFLPVGLLMRDQYRVDTWISEVSEPTFVAHGAADRTIGVMHGERLYALAPAGAGLWIEPGADHSDLWARGLWARAQAFFDTVQ